MLVVEDDQRIRDCWRDICTRKGFRVTRRHESSGVHPARLAFDVVSDITCRESGLDIARISRAYPNSRSDADSERRRRKTHPAWSGSTTTWPSLEPGELLIRLQEYPQGGKGPPGRATRSRWRLHVPRRRGELNGARTPSSIPSASATARQFAQRKGCRSPVTRWRDEYTGRTRHRRADYRLRARSKSTPPMVYLQKLGEKAKLYTDSVMIENCPFSSALMSEFLI